jgi:hypothetical protein
MMEVAAILPLLAVYLTAAQAATAQTSRVRMATIDGFAVNIETGEPLSGVHIGLYTPRSAETPVAFGAISGRDGHFSMGAIQPGSYRLYADLRGFSFVPAKHDPQGFSVSLRPGQHIANFKVEMARHATIAGRVLDENADPVANAGIAVVHRPQDSLSVDGGSYVATSDDRGEFRWAGAPGKYYVRAEPAEPYSPGSFATPEVRTDGTSPPANGSARPIYPDATSGDGAVIVVAEPGKTASNIEIRLVRRRTFTVAGAVTGAQEGCKRFTIVLHGNDDDSEINAPDAKFSFANLNAGDHTLHAECSLPDGKLRTPVLELKLDESDKTNLDLDLTPGGDLVGSVEIPNPSQATVRLEPPKGLIIFRRAQCRKMARSDCTEFLAISFA